ncbi:MAG TPA: DUF3048 domain-containing protein [Candidatus Saccharimonadales bacterium]|nr:DUF3048 domain-containing protein [Candidatus Saccharimonadales bacterium]
MLDDFKSGKSKSKLPVKEEKPMPEIEAKEPEPDIEVNIDKDNNLSDLIAPDTAENKEAVVGSVPPKSKKKGRFKAMLNWKSFSKKKKILVICGGVILLLLIVGGVILLTDRSHPKQAAIYKVVKPKPVTYISRLTGLPVSQAQSVLPVTGIMIENLDAARPQSGLSAAGVVFEAVAEGGITRFLALYEDQEPSSVGPIRSARPYYVDWLLGFDAAYAHVGGSPDGLAAIASLHVKDLDQFYNGSSYTRITSRPAPHNVYTSLADLISLEDSKGYKTSTFTGFPRKADQPSKTPSATSIDFTPSSVDYSVHYDYDSSLNSYKRSEGEAPQVDANTNKQLEPKVVIGIVVPQSQGALDASGAYYTEYQDIGSGTADVFQDGTVTQGTWVKTAPTSQIQFLDAAGKPIDLNAGQTWITVLGSANEISYK